MSRGFTQPADDEAANHLERRRARVMRAARRTPITATLPQADVEDLPVFLSTPRRINNLNELPSTVTPLALTVLGKLLTLGRIFHVGVRRRWRLTGATFRRAVAAQARNLGAVREALWRNRDSKIPALLPRVGWFSDFAANIARLRLADRLRGVPLELCAHLAAAFILLSFAIGVIVLSPKVVSHDHVHERVTGVIGPEPRFDFSQELRSRLLSGDLSSSSLPPAGGETSIAKVSENLIGVLRSVPGLEISGSVSYGAATSSDVENRVLPFGGEEMTVAALPTTPAQSFLTIADLPDNSRFNSKTDDQLQEREASPRPATTRVPKHHRKSVTQKERHVDEPQPAPRKSQQMAQLTTGPAPLARPPMFVSRPPQLLGFVPPRPLGEAAPPIPQQAPNTYLIPESMSDIFKNSY